MIQHGPAHLALRNRLLAVSGIPAQRAFENKLFTPTTGTPYLADQFVPATQRLLTVPAANGTVEETGLYVVQWFGLSDDGFVNIRAGVDAILAAFSPGTTITSTTGDVLRIRSDTATQAGQIIPLDSGFALCTITIPWRAHSQNAIAA